MLAHIRQMNRIQTLIFFILCIITCKGQDSVFIDSRDGKAYPIVTLGNLHWLKSNLSYETATSWCKQHGKEADCNDGNFYYYTELDSVCPQSWRVPTWSDWENTIKVIMNIHKIPPDSVETKKLPADSVILDSSKYFSSSFMRTGVYLLNDTLSLDIKPIGWIQGEKKKNQGHRQANIWIIDPSTNDPITHVHIEKNNYVMHGHYHHIIDKPKRQRRFSVRCVKEKEL